MLRFATIATETYFPYTRMLYNSLLRSNPDAELTVYCDRPFRPSDWGAGDQLRVRHLPSIQTLGVKRAKFDLYADMAGQPFVYVDSDVIVLEDLSALFDLDRLAACPDELRECSFIPDPDYPWPGDPALRNRFYCNTGLLFVPPSQADFFARIRELALRDDEWGRYIVPGHLYDNHFLCAMLNRFDVEFLELEPTEYGWQGLRSWLSWNVVEEGDQLIHRETGRPLRLAHFAGGQDPHFFLARMPPWLAARLQRQSGPQTMPAPRSTVRRPPPPSVTRFLEGELGSVLRAVQDEFIRRVLDLCAREIDGIIAEPARVDLGNESFFRNHEEFKGLLFAQNGTPGAEWQGLRCNRAYLTPEEYRFIELCLDRYSIRSVVEIGAGETSILFRRRGCTVTSVEYQEGPWADRARTAGADVHIVPFDTTTRRFSRESLAAALRGRHFDLAFVDSPEGTENRRSVPEQILEHATVAYLLVHDVARDHANVFQWMRDQGWEVVEYQPTYRGILLLRRIAPTPRASNPIHALLKEAGDQPAPRGAAAQPDAGSQDPFVCEVVPLGMVGPFLAGGRYFVPTTLINRSSRPLGSDDRISLSYHWKPADGSGGVTVWDGERTAIEPAMWPGESRTVLAEVRAPPTAGRYLLVWDLVEEGVTWFSALGFQPTPTEVEVVAADLSVPLVPRSFALGEHDNSVGHSQLKLEASS